VTAKAALQADDTMAARVAFLQHCADNIFLEHQPEEQQPLLEREQRVGRGAREGRNPKSLHPGVADLMEPRNGGRGPFGVPQEVAPQPTGGTLLGSLLHQLQARKPPQPLAADCHSLLADFLTGPGQYQADSLSGRGRYAEPPQPSRGFSARLPLRTAFSEQLLAATARGAVMQPGLGALSPTRLEEELLLQQMQGYTRGQLAAAASALMAQGLDSPPQPDERGHLAANKVKPYYAAGASSEGHSALTEMVMLRLLGGSAVKPAAAEVLRRSGPVSRVAPAIDTATGGGPFTELLRDNATADEPAATGGGRSYRRETAPQHARADEPRRSNESRDGDTPSVSAAAEPCAWHQNALPEQPRDGVDAAGERQVSGVPSEQTATGQRARELTSRVLEDWREDDSYESGAAELPSREGSHEKWFELHEDDEQPSPKVNPPQHPPCLLAASQSCVCWIIGSFQDTDTATKQSEVLWRRVF
jgi:hypothetical protein